MKIPNMKYAPIFSEDVYQDLLKDTLKNSQSIINSLYSMIHFVLANNYSNSQYDYDVLFLVGIKGAQIAIDTYDYKEKFIDHARTIIKLKIKSQLDNKKYPTLTKDYDKFVLSIIEKLQIDKQYEKKCMSYIKYYVETAKASYREIILRYYGFYGKNYSFSELSELVNLSQHIVEVVISKFETNVKVRFKKKEVSLSTKLNVLEEKQKDKVKQEEQSNQKPVKYKSFYDRVKSYVSSEEEMWDIFDSLSEDYKNALIQMYGPNLDVYHEVTPEIKKTIYNIINNKFKKRQKTINYISLYDRVKKYVSSKSEMWEIFNSLSEDYKNTLIQMYGPNLDEYHDVTTEIKGKISNIINSKFKNKTKTIKKLNFYERVKKYVSSKEEMLEIFNSLSEDYKNTLIQIYGPNLDEYHEVSSEIRTKVSDIIKYKFKLKHKNRIVSLYERVKKYVSSEEEMREIFNSLSEDYKNTLIQMYGTTLNEYHEVTDELRKKVNLIIYNKFKRKHKNKYKTLYDRVKKYVSSEEEMWEIFNSLNKYYQNVLIQMYGPNLDDYNDKVSEEIIKKIPGIIDNKFKNKTKNRKNFNFYERVKPYITNKEEMFEIFNSLSEDYKKILIQAYGPNLDEFFEVSSEIKQKIKYIIQKEFKNKIKKHFKLFYDRVKKYVSSEEEMWDIFNSLSEEYKKILIQMYGPNLDEYHEVSSEIKTKVSYIIINRFKMKHKNRKISLYERVKSYVSSEEDMWNIFNSLSEDYKNTLIQMYGPNLDEYFEVSSEIKTKVSYIIKFKFKNKIKNKKSISLYDRVKSYVSSKEEMWEIFNSLSEDYKNILIQMYGPNLDEYHDVSSEIKTKVSYIINNRFKMKYKNRKISLYDRVKFYVSSEEDMWNIFNSLSEYYKSALIQMYGPNLDEYHEVSSKVKKTISNIINNKFRMKHKNRKISLFNSVKSFVSDEQEMWEIFNALSKDLKDALIQMYGPNLDDYNDEVSNDVKKKVKNIIYTKFNRRVPNVKGLSLYERLIDYSENDVNTAISLLDAKEKEKLYMRYGYDLSNPVKVPISKEMIEEVENVIIPKLRLILERNKRKPIFRIDENMVLELSKLFGLLKIKDSANKKDILITLIYLYCMESNLSITKLEEMLEIEKDEIDVIVKGVISNYNSAIYEMYLKFMGLLNQTDKKDNLHIGFISSGDKNE